MNVFQKITFKHISQITDAGKHMTTVKAYCGLARLELAQPELSRNLDQARDYIEAGLSMVKEILPNSINQVELLIVRGDIELIETNGEFVKKQQCKKNMQTKVFLVQRFHLE